MRRALLLGACGAGLLLSTVATTPWAQGYPTRPIRIIAPFPAAGAADIVARVIAQRLAEQLGVSAIVDNRPGAAGAIGSEIVANAVPDGHTLLIGVTASHGINPALQKLSYDAVKDFAPVSLVATIPHILVVNPANPARTLQEFIKYAKAKPGMTFGSAGIGTPHHLAGEFLKIAAGLDLVHVPYKGSAPALTDLVGGQLDFMSIEYAAAFTNIKAGKLRALAVASLERLPGVDMPTFAEAGLPGFEVTAWYAVFAPARTPPAIVNLLSKEIARGLAMPETRERFAQLMTKPVGSTPEELATFMKADIARWAKVIKQSGVKPE